MQGESFPLPVGDISQSDLTMPPACREMISLHPQSAHRIVHRDSCNALCCVAPRMACSRYAGKCSADRNSTCATGDARGIIPLARRRHEKVIRTGTAGGKQKGALRPLSVCVVQSGYFLPSINGLSRSKGMGMTVDVLPEAISRMVCR